MNAIKVIIADDHPIVRKGLVTIIDDEEDIKVVAQAENSSELIEQVKLHQPDLVLIDMQMPDFNGIEAINRIREFNENVKFVILTTFDDQEYVFEGIKAGARGYLLKDINPDELIEAIRKVHHGYSLIEPSLTTKLLDRFTQLAKKAPLEHSLTNRELEVLQQIANGASNQEIADALFISIKTVKTHITHIFEKLQVRDRTEAVTKALKLGIIKL